MSNNNVLAIDEKIRQKFESDYSKLPSYKEKLADLEKSLGSESLSDSGISGDGVSEESELRAQMP